jgi:alkylation response protein AidB-like acyl-CoA dehydrogenase
MIVSPRPALAVLAGAARIADEVLFPAATEVDAAVRIPPAHLDLLASEGLYALAGPPELGGLGTGASWAVTEILAGGCLATTFVWGQHHRAVRAAAAAPAPLRDRWLAPLCRGQHRAGLALGGALPGPPRLRARKVTGGYLLHGSSPWVTGWGMIDTLYTAARDDQDNVLTALVPVRPGRTMAAEPLRLVAVNASATVQLELDGHFVPDEGVTGSCPHSDWLARDAAGLRSNGSLALGVAARCARLAGPGPLDARLAGCREALDAAGPRDLPAARAAAAELALRAAAALVTTQGSQSVLAGQHAQRLAREAVFLLVFGSRPAIKENLIGLLTGPDPSRLPRRTRQNQ